MTVEHLDRGPLERAEIAKLVALDILPGSYMNLGIGQPTMVADHLPSDSGIVLHTENGMLGMRGGHLDVCVLGAFQVSAQGDLANWHTGEPGAIPAVGGAMDLAIGAKDVYVMMTLFGTDGAAKLVRQCSYPLTARACVTRVYTDYAVFLIGDGRVRARDTFGMPVTELASRTRLDLQA